MNPLVQGSLPTFWFSVLKRCLNVLWWRLAICILFLWLVQRGSYLYELYQNQPYIS